MTPEPIHAGVRPWFPGPLGRWDWLAGTVPAERMAALRVAVALALLVDLCTTHLPHFALLFGPDGFGAAGVADARFVPGRWSWSVLRWLPGDWGPGALMGVWLASAVALLVGWRPLVSGLVAWACAVSFFNINVGMTNGGDRVRNSLLLAVAFGSSGAAWGVSAARNPHGRPVVVPAWPARVLFVQLAALYFVSGYHKLVDPAWRSGYAMYYAAHELSWSTFPGLSTAAPVWAHRLASWGTLAWEVGFPALAVMRGTRTATLVLGFVFHALTLVTLEIGPFAVYAMAAYAAFVPWERRGAGANPPAPAGVGGDEAR